jgi:hypothetical protein
MYGYEFTEEHEQCLREQVITADQPAPILRDFRVLLDFLGPKGVETAGKYNLLPIKFIGELDARLSRPLHLELKRPQIRSHPYLLGLNLLLRASGLTRVEGTGAKARLVLDSTMMAQWDQLNFTEQYFNLLEAWLRYGRPEAIGESGSSWDRMLMKCLQKWQNLPPEGFQSDPKNPEGVHVYWIGYDYFVLALMDLFGLLRVDLPRRPVTTWKPAGVRHVLFGDAVCNRLGSQIQQPWKDEFDQVDDDDDEDQDDDDDDDVAEELPRFGAWQPLFQTYFPEWQKNLEFPRLEPREGTYIFRVSLGDIWRLIAMPSRSNLEDFVDVILRSVKFDDEHLYQFTYRDRMGGTARVKHPAMDEGPWTDRVKIGTLPLVPSQTMEFVYDFGDNWEFTIKLERIEPPGGKNKAPRILERHGKSPKQYPSWDD